MLMKAYSYLDVYLWNSAGLCVCGGGGCVCPCMHVCVVCVVCNENNTLTDFLLWSFYAYIFVDLEVCAHLLVRYSATEATAIIIIIINIDFVWSN